MKKMRSFFLEQGQQMRGIPTWDWQRRGEESSTEKMESGKRTGPNERPAEVWKSLGEEGTDVFRIY